MHTRVTPAVVPPLRWGMWAIPIFLFLIGVFHRSAPGVIARDLMQAFEATGATIGLLAAAYFYSYAALMVPAGLLLDAFGVRRVLTACGAVMGIDALVNLPAPARPDRAGGRVTPRPSRRESAPGGAAR
jgi:fucose permease